MSNTTIELPNPFTSLAWLPPSLAEQLEVARYLCCAVIGAYFWEVLMSLPSEYKMFKEHRLAYSDVVYVLARISSAAYLITTFVFAIAPVENCQAVTVSAAIIGTLAVPLNCLLFYFRIRAVFSGSRLITVFFGFLWVCTLGASITAPFGTGAIHIGTTKNCISNKFKNFISAGLIAAAVNDTLVFLFISAKLISSSFTDSWKGRFTLFFSGRGMGKVSRVLLQTGQLYYLATVSINLVSMVCILTPSVPEVYRAVFTVPNLALLNAMACRVFRLLRLGLLKETAQSLSVSSHPALPSAASESYQLRFYQRKQTETSGHTQEDAPHITTTQTTLRDGTQVRKVTPVRIWTTQEVEVDQKDGWKGGDLA